MAPSPTPTNAADALLVAIGEAAPDQRTACAGWSAHDLVAHLAAGAAEMAELAQDKVEGRPSRATRGFAEREAPFRDLGHDRLVARLVDESLRMVAAFKELSITDDPFIDFTGARIGTERMATHARSEAALHRWDLVGDDEVSRVLLADPALTSHAVWTLNAMPTLDESARAVAARAAGAGTPAFRVSFRSPGEPDVVLAVAGGSGTVEYVPDATADLILVLPADQRLLALWGRRAVGFDALGPAVDGDPSLLVVLDRVLWRDAGRRRA